MKNNELHIRMPPYIVHAIKVDSHAVCVCVRAHTLLFSHFGPIRKLGKLNTVCNINFYVVKFLSLVLQVFRIFCFS
jgi:hypothetical protein